MTNDALKGMLEDWRKLNSSVKFYEIIGAVERALEVESNSLVQLMVVVQLQDNKPVYQYYQQWVSKMPASERQLLEGAYHGEIIGNFKILGIYNGTPGSEMIFKTNDLKK